MQGKISLVIASQPSNQFNYNLVKNLSILDDTETVPTVSGPRKYYSPSYFPVKAANIQSIDIQSRFLFYVYFAFYCAHHPHNIVSRIPIRTKAQTTELFGLRYVANYCYAVERILLFSVSVQRLNRIG